MTDVPVSSPTGGPNAVAPTIADVSYRNYDGPLQSHAVRWWAIALSTIRQNVNRRKYGYWIPAVLIGIVYLFQAIIFYVTANLRQQVESQGGFLPGGPPNPYSFTLYTSFTWTYLFLFSAALTVGSASIAADNRANALLVYLSKPLTRVDYLIGKWVGVFLLLAALSTIPAILLYLFFLITYYSDGFLTGNGGLWWRVLVVSLMAPAVHASLIVGISAWSKTPRVAAATYAAFYFISGNLAGTIALMLLERNRDSNTPNTTAALVNNLHVDGVSNGVTQHLLNISQKQVVARFAGGGQRERVREALKPTKDPKELERRKKWEQRDQERAERRRERVQSALDHVPEKPPLLPIALLGAAFITLPLLAAHTKVKAVEVIRG